MPREQFSDAIRSNWGYWQARNDRERGARLPMQLFQNSRKGQPTRDVEQIARHHFDRAYARGYVKGWQEVTV